MSEDLVQADSNEASSNEKVTQASEWLGGPFGGSLKTETCPASRSMSDTTPATTTQMGGVADSLSGREKASFSEPTVLTLSLFGEILSTTAARKASTAPSFGTKVCIDPRSLSDRLTKSLITSGLVAGITPSSVRKTFGLAIRDFASLPLDGVHVGTRRAAFEFSNDYPFSGSAGPVTFSDESGSDAASLNQTTSLPEASS